MDDPLKHKTIPLSAETILWFEFLLDPSLLTVHLLKEKADPSPIELMSQFLSIPQDNQPPIITPTTTPIDITSEVEVEPKKNDGLKLGRKQLAIKILTLKVASHLKWNLEILEKNLPVQKQLQLLADLCCVTAGKIINLPLPLRYDYQQLGPEGNKRAFNFALTLYHRWVLRAQVYKELPERVIKPGFNHILATQEQTNSLRDDVLITSLEPFTQSSIEFLTQMCADNEQFITLTYDSFVALHSNSDRTAQNFEDAAINVSKTEQKAQICFDLCVFYLHMTKYDLAKVNALACRINLIELKKEYEKRGKTSNDYMFCTVDEKQLEGYLLACGVGAEQQLGLKHRMNESILHQYDNITDVLKADNISNEISMVDRRICELDIEGGISSGKLKILKETAVQVAALNALKSVLEDEDLFDNNDFLRKYQNKNGLNILIETTAQLLPSIDSDKRIKLKQYFLNILLTNDSNEIQYEIKKLNLFTEDELTSIKQRKDGIEIKLPQIVQQKDWKMCENKVNRLEFGLMKRQLIMTTSAYKVTNLLLKLAHTSPGKPLWTINPSWQLPMSMRAVIQSLPRGYLQDFSYIIICKARELARKNDFRNATQMLDVLKRETQRNELGNIMPVTKLNRAIDLEILLFQINQTLEEWPKKIVEHKLMINRCKQYLLSIQQTGENVLNRLEIFDFVTVILLNFNEWNSLIFPDKRFPSNELCLVFASACLDIDTYKNSKKVNREAWDLVLPMFSTLPNKRGGVGSNSGNMIGGNSSAGSGGGGGSGGGAGSGSSRDSPTLMLTNLNVFLKRLRDPLIISVVLSLLCKIHNILRDDPNSDINTEYLLLWPSTVSNASGYSVKTVSETINNLIHQGLKYNPQHIPFIRLKGDLEFANENYETAMSSYVNALITASEYCALHLQRPYLDDYIIRRMVKCSSNLGCNMQAAVLCQFLEEIDYTLAFKSISEKTTFKLSEKSSMFSDSMDAYYNYIWDPTILEFIINTHSKKGEHKKKQQAINVIGLLELNANNNEEIKREAASIRRTKFLRALAKQYIL